MDHFNKSPENAPMAASYRFAGTNHKRGDSGSGDSHTHWLRAPQRNAIN